MKNMQKKSFSRHHQQKPQQLCEAPLRVQSVSSSRKASPIPCCWLLRPTVALFGQQARCSGHSLLLLHLKSGPGGGEVRLDGWEE